MASRAHLRWWLTLLVVAAWLGWVTLIGLVHTRICIQDGLDAQLTGSGQELVGQCRGPSWDAPVRGLRWAWPVDWELGYWLTGTVAARALAAWLLVVRRRRAS